MSDFDLSKIVGGEPPIEQEHCELCVEQHDIWMTEMLQLAERALGEPLDSDQDPMEVLKVCIAAFKSEIKELKGKTMEKPTCETCPYYDSWSSKYSSQKAALRRDAFSADGVCRRYPDRMNNKRNEEWCGEHLDFPKWLEEQGK